MTIILIAIITLIDQCSTINLRTASIFKNKTLNNYQYPTNGIASTNYKLERLNDKFYGAICYSKSTKKYFVFSHPTILVLDSNGNTIHSFNTPKEGHPIQAAPFVEAEQQFYDLNQQTLQPIPLKMFWRKDFPKLKDWSAMFATYYNQASTVVYSRYGRDANNKSAQRAFLKINSEWYCFILHDRLILKNDFQTLITSKQFPAKAERLQYLVDTKTQTASTHSKEQITTLKQQTSNLTELNESYTKQQGPEIIFYQKEIIYEKMVYTPIPIITGGIAYYNLKIKNDILPFKEHSHRSIAAWNPRNYAKLFTVPTQLENQLKASFLVLEYPSNDYESGAAGIYVIKPNE